ncbi:unnamed protein product [Mucor hiemalis]
MGVAEMVLDTFTGYNPHAPFIIFLDGDRTNANLNNLRAASREEYSEHLVETLPRRGDYDLSPYWISNITGMIYSELSNKLLAYDSQVPYASLGLAPRNLNAPVRFLMHQLVRNAHVEPNQPQYDIDHVYGNTLDVSAVNLRMVCRLANVKLAYALDRGKDLRDVTLEQLRFENFNIDHMADAPAGQVARRNRVQFPAWSMEEIALEIKQGTWASIHLNNEDTGYLVSKLGMVRRRGKRTLVATTIGTGGYVYVTLSIDGHPMTRGLHTVMARAFVENNDPENKLVVDHINGDRTDFSIENLEWVTQQENMVRAMGVGVDVYDADNELVDTFCSLPQCAQHFDFDGRRYTAAHLGDVSRRGGILHGGYYLVRK